MAWQEEGRALLSRVCGHDGAKMFFFPGAEPDKDSNKFHDTVIIMCKNGALSDL